MGAKEKNEAGKDLEVAGVVREGLTEMVTFEYRPGEDGALSMQVLEKSVFS